MARRGQLQSILVRGTHNVRAARLVAERFGSKKGAPAETTKGGIWFRQMSPKGFRDFRTFTPVPAVSLIYGVRNPTTKTKSRNPTVRLSAAETAAWHRGGKGKAALVRLFTIGAHKLGTTVVVDHHAKHLHTFARRNPEAFTGPEMAMLSVQHEFERERQLRERLARAHRNAGKKPPATLQGQVVMFPESMQQDVRQLHIPTTPEARREAAAHAAMLARKQGTALQNARRRPLHAGVIECSLNDAEFQRWKSNASFRLRLIGQARSAARKAGRTAIIIHRAHTLATLR